MLTAGTKLGFYEIAALLGKGGMGEVYRARDSKLGRDVALKILPDAFARDPDRMARFQREAKLLAALNHTNIASIYGLEDSGSTHALVMELAEGPTLSDRIRSGPLPIDEAIAIARQIAEALEYAHERGIVHRDLKPSNVKVSRDDSVKILDFGLAKAIEGHAADADLANSPTISRMATQAGILLGTAAYMSPEQAKGKPVDRRTDIWAFGCVLYEMLTGKMAFRGETVTDTLAAVIRAEPDWSQRPSTTPIRVGVLLQRCLQKDPKQRLRDIGDARISLDEVLSGAPDPAIVGTSQAAVPLWRRALPWVATAALAVVAAFFAFLHFHQPSLATPQPMRFDISLPDKTTLATNSTFALSPDGWQLAFAASGPDGTQRLWIRPIDSLEARPLPDSGSPSYPPFFWSPDSRFIAYDGGGKLEKIDISGGPPQTLCDVSSTVVGGTWSRDGVIIFSDVSIGLMRVSADGGPASPVTRVDPSRGETAHILPSFLPDGRHFLYNRLSTSPGNNGLYVGSVDATPGQQSLKGLSESDESGYVTALDGSGQVLFIRDGALVSRPFDMRRLDFSGPPVVVADHVGSFGGFGFFSISAHGLLVYRSGNAMEHIQLTWFDRQGKRVGMAGEPGTFLTTVISPDGSHLALAEFGTGSTPNAIWLLDVSRNTSTRFTFGLAAAGPVWSPDGTRIIFTGYGNGDLFEKPTNGGTDERLLLKSDYRKIPMSWSRDGRFLLYTVLNPQTKGDLWVLPLDGREKPFPFLNTQFDENFGQFSPDGHWVAYTSDESGRNEVYARPFLPDSAGTVSDVGGKWLVSNSGGSEPRWRGDGRELFYRDFSGRLMAVEIAAGRTFQAGVPKVLFAVPEEGGPSMGLRWDVTPDGKRFLLPVAPSTSAPFTAVLNWQAALKK